MSGNRRWMIWAGGGVAAALLLWLIAPEVYTGTFSDLDTFLRVVGWVALLGGWTFLVMRFVPWRPVALGLAGVPIIIAAWTFLWPYLRPPTEVDEAFPPTAEAVADDAAQTAASAPPATETSDGGDATTTEPAASTTPESVPAATDADEPDRLDEEAEEAEEAAQAERRERRQRRRAAREAAASTAPPTTPAPTPPPTPPPTTVPPGPVELRRASFQGLTGHRGSGQAAVYRLEDSSILLRFENVDIGSGPALNVYLVPGADQRGLGGAVYVAPLTAERGNQNYIPPAGVDITSGTWTVLVWCETFTVEVANATLF